MTKEFYVSKWTVGNLGNIDTWYKASDIVLCNNSGKTPIRIDKEMLQISAYHNAVAPVIIGVAVHLSDETGATFTDQIVNGTTTDSGLSTLLNQWKDNVFMTDYQMVGTGFDEADMVVMELAADTRRILAPGQKLVATLMARPVGAETTKNVHYMVDNLLWYSQASQ